jgi:hypothetical protein
MKPENQKELIQRFVKLVRRINSAFEQGNWPLRDDERISLLKDLEDCILHTRFS